MNSSASPTRAFPPVFTAQAGARAVALVTFLFLLNAFIQSGGIRALEVVIGLGWLGVVYLLSARFSVPGVLALTFLGGVAWGLFIESVPVSDWHYYFMYAQRLSQGLLHAPFDSNFFTTTVYGGVFHRLFGSGWVTNYIASALVWTLGSALVYLAIAPFAGKQWGDRRLARFVCFALALCPTFLVFSPVLGSKGMFFLVSALCAWLVSKHLRSAQWNPWIYLGLGLAAGLLYLTRPHGALLLAVGLVIILATGPAPGAARAALLAANPLKPARKNLLAAATLLAVFAAVVLAHGWGAYLSGYGFQLGTHHNGWFVLLFGTSVAAGGMYNDADVELLRKDTPPLAERNRRARELALERIDAAGVPGFLTFALTKKLRGLYGRDTKLFRRAHGESERAEMLQAYVQPAAERIEQGAYRLVFLLFLALLAREVWRPSRRLVLGVIVLLYSLPHLLLEVYQRYHMLMLPYFVAGAALLAWELAPVANTANRKLHRILYREPDREPDREPGGKPWWRPERFTPGAS